MANRNPRHRVIVVSRGGQVLSRVGIARAATMLATGVAHPLTDSARLAVLRSPSIVVDVHEMIQVTGSADRPWRLLAPDAYASHRVILERDGRRCAYCGSRASTVDHVLPRCRGGLDTFDNLVAACSPCNSRKADRTPAEARMTLLWAPHAYDPWRTDQELVHQLFSLTD